MAITPTRAMITNRPERIIKGFQRTVIGLISLGSWYRTAGVVDDPAGATVQVVLRASDARRWKSSRSSRPTGHDVRQEALRHRSAGDRGERGAGGQRLL